MAWREPLARAAKLEQVTARRLPSTPALVAAGLLIAGGLALSLLSFFPTLQAADRRLALLASFIPYGLVAWALAALILIWSGRRSARLVALVPVVGLIVNATVLLPYLDSSHNARPGTPATLRIVALNMHYGQADPAALLEVVQREQPDVVILSEFTQTAAPILTDPRWTTLLPYHVGTIGTAGVTMQDGDSSGTQVLSRTPLQQVGQTTGTTATNLAVRLTTQGHQLVLIAAHPVNPIRGGLDGWLSDGSALTSLAERFDQGPLVVAGDLNAVPEHLTVRNLMAATGLHEVMQGWAPTYPADRLIPLITIDHVLASDQFRTVAVRRFHVDNTDHLGTVAELAQS